MLDFNRFSIRQLANQDLAGRRVLLRLDLNLPMTAGVVADTFRLEQSLPTIKFLLERGATVIALSHLSGDARLSLQPVATALGQYWPVNFVPDWLAWLERGPKPLPPASLWLFDNLRQAAGEEKNDPEFTRKLGAWGDLFVNDAFSASHREHASVVGLPRALPSFIGETFASEVASLSRLFDPAHPFVVVLGGAKFGTKLPLVEKFLKIADDIFIYGALANVFFRRLGAETGQSLVDEEVKITNDLLRHPKINLPIDVRTRDGNRVGIKSFRAVSRGDSILDIGLQSIEAALEKISEAKTILWNGPVGLCEDGFTGGTKAIAQLITASPARTVIGGGDTIAAVSKLGLLNQFSFVSTGGGAMLDFLANGTLPGLEALAISPNVLK